MATIAWQEKVSQLVNIKAAGPFMKIGVWGGVNRSVKLQRSCAFSVVEHPPPATPRATIAESEMARPGLNIG
jgi:hypothetical protein